MSVSLQIKQTKSIHAKLNDLLTVIVLLLGLYLVIMPLWPQIAFWLKKEPSINSYLAISEEKSEDGNNEAPSNKINGNKLIIPQMKLEADINEGSNVNTLSKGAWRRPNTSTPDKGGNTVIVGHRFVYSSTAIFYHLDKLKTGDEFIATWDGKIYKYRVSETKVVSPYKIQIENNTDKPILTLYTCTPMWTSKDRLVVISDLIEVKGQ
jgi:sortase A